MKTHLPNYHLLYKKTILFLLCILCCPLWTLKASSGSLLFYGELFIPSIPAGQQFEVVEGSATGTIVGTVQATDAVSINSFQITAAEAMNSGASPNDLNINAAELFQIDNNGELTVKDPTHLLAVVGPVKLTIQASNINNEKSSSTVDVLIKDEVVNTTNSETISWSNAKAQDFGNSEGQSVVVGGKLYSFSGFDIEKKPYYTPTERAYAYDPKGDSWSLLKAMPKMHPNSAHGGVTHAGFTTDGTDIYFVGGYAASSNGIGQIFGTKYGYKYNVANDTYERLPDLPHDRSAGTLEYINGKLYWVGGTNLARNQEQSDLLVLDLSNLSAGWKYLTSSPLPNPRNHIGSAVLNGKLYIVGGQHKQDGELTTQDDVHMYDPQTDKWTKVTDLPDINEVPDNLTPGKGHITGSTFAYDGKIFVLGGEYKFLGPYSKAVLAYDPENDEWTRYTDMPASRASGIAGVVDGVLYYSTGKNASTTFKAGLGPASNDKGIWLESECGEVGSSWTTVEDADASGGSYVVAKNLNSYSEPADAPDNRVRFTFNISEEGVYHLFARVRAFSSSDDSFWVRLDDGNWIQWWQGISTGSTFNWNEVSESPFTLSSGNHTIDIAYRESNAQLDKLHLNKSGKSPAGIGGDAVNCGTSPNQAPVALASANPSSGAAPLTVNFDGNSSTDDNGIESYSWIFGDGQSASGAEVSHTYSSSGVYTVILTVIDAGGLQDKDTLQINVQSGTASGEEIWLEGECSELGSSWTVIEDGAASGGSYVVAENVNNYSEPSDVPSNRVRFNFNLSEAGTYHLFARVRALSSGDDSFWVRLDDGNWIQWWQGITTGSTFNWNEVSDSPFPLSSGSHTLDFAYRESNTQLDKLHLNQSGTLPVGQGEIANNCSASSNKAPVASISASPLNGTAPLNVSFNASASTDDSGIVSYNWVFGDGQSASGSEVSHTYASPGEYTVTLTVSDAENLKDEATVKITVNQAQPAFQAIRLNSGGATLSMNGNEFVADNSTSPPYYDSQHTYANTNLNAPALYQTERGSEQNNGTITYQIPVPNGNYTVRTHHSELYYGFNGRTARKGRRIFDISIEGNLVKDDLDLFEEGVGVDKNYLVLTFNNISVSDGTLTLLMDASVNRPTISGIEIEEAGSVSNEEIPVLSSAKIGRFSDYKGLNISVFPNAVGQNNILNLRTDMPEIKQGVEATIFDQNGRVLSEGLHLEKMVGNDITIDISSLGLAPGVYYVQLKSKLELSEPIRFIKE
ncbi:PKD domain-containing protein [Porifericola rhodea]|uniref:PKD domain-containing protein n=1 Tax=Porifericola rhodea TaxID=930972 RepID=UPI002666CC03|nr:PKD domain-containing protein [Porifericola rhodea]WKN31500.1 PKD domain-containing protein [Porifericola rhodea]